MPGDFEEPKLFGVYYHVATTSAVQSMQKPCLAFRNGYNPDWVDLKRNPFEFGETYSRDARYVKNRYLVGLSIGIIVSNLYWKSGWKFYLGTITQPGILLPVPIGAEDLITGPLSYYATWQGKVPAPYGFAIWSHKITSGDDLYISAMIEDVKQ